MCIFINSSLNSKKYDYIYDSKLLEEVFDKKKLDINNEVNLVKSFYVNNSPYDYWGEYDYLQLQYLKRINSNKNEITTPSVETVAKSDAEMHRNLASEKQFKQVKHSVVSTSNKKRIIK